MNGNLLIVSAPSGAGKTTLVGGLLARDSRVRLSISSTTRAPRPGERDGVDYHFVPVSRFEQMQAAGEFVESAHVHGNYYGTSRAWLEQALASGTDVLLEIDWQGARQVRQAFPAATGIFVLPPSVDELERRLRARGQDAEDVIQRRVAAAVTEMRHADEYEYAIINNKLDDALEDLVALVRALRLRFTLQRQRSPEVFSFN